MDESKKPPWSELPEDLLAKVFACFFSPDERARLQAVCRSWRSAARPPPPPRQMPWIMLPFGGFLSPYNRVLHRLVSFPNTTSSIGSADYHNPLLFSFPKTTRCVGSTNSWMAIDCADAKNRHRYYLHNEFSSTTLSLPELDAAIGHVSELFKICKVLLRSTPDDVIALMTNHPSCPIILTRRGKGVWFPRWHAAPLTRIIDVVFLEDRLYGITQAEDLVFLDIASDDNGVPMVTGGECVIGEDFDVWSNEEDWEDGDDDDDNNDGDAYDDDGDHDFDVDDDSIDYEDKYDNDDDEDYDEIEDDDQHTHDLTKMTKEDMILEAIETVDVDDEFPHEIKPSINNVFRRKPFINTTWYLIESRGKLLMVRRQVIWVNNENSMFTHKVEVFEADMSASKWVPVERGLDGQALFISRPFCKSISTACSKEIQEDTIYFIDTDDVFDMRSKTVSAIRDDWAYTTTLRNGDVKELTWVFPPKLVAY
jgi:hypothetical protein